MKYSRLLRLSAAGSRRAANWPLQRMNLEDFYSRLKTPVRSAETLDAYLRMPKAKQTPAGGSTAADCTAAGSRRDRRRV